MDGLIPVQKLLKEQSRLWSTGTYHAHVIVKNRSRLSSRRKGRYSE